MGSRRWEAPRRRRRRKWKSKLASVKFKKIINPTAV
jgi:hypothetical protein